VALNICQKKKGTNERTKKKPVNRHEKKNREKKVVYIAADIPDSTSQKAKIAMAWAKN